MNALTFSQAVDGYLLYAGARRLSQNTINDYTNTFDKFLTFLNGDPYLKDITSNMPVWPTPNAIWALLTMNYKPLWND